MKQEDKIKEIASEFNDGSNDRVKNAIYFLCRAFIDDVYPSKGTMTTNEKKCKVCKGRTIFMYQMNQGVYCHIHRKVGLVVQESQSSISSLTPQEPISEEKKINSNELDPVAIELLRQSVEFTPQLPTKESEFTKEEREKISDILKDKVDNSTTVVNVDTKDSWKERLENWPLFQLPAHVVRVTGIDKNGNSYEGQAFNIVALVKEAEERGYERGRKEWIEIYKDNRDIDRQEERKSILEKLLGKVEGMKKEEDYEIKGVRVKFLQEYNDALSEVLQMIEGLEKENE